MKKIDNYLRAVNNLGEAVAVCRAVPDNALLRDGLIQRFELAVELAWKSAKDYLTDQGVQLEYSTPRYVLKEAYAAGLLRDEQTWLDILSARNQSAHLYDEAVAAALVKQITDRYLPAFEALAAFYRA